MTKIYKPKNHIRIVTATSLFDGHDAAINIMRRILQSTGVEVIHLGHNRSVTEIVETAIQEDVQAIAITSYQGGHLEFFKYMFDLLKEKGYSHIKIFGGGGGVILPDETEELEKYGITKIYSPDDGRKMGLQGMINDLVEKSDFQLTGELNFDVNDLQSHNHNLLSRLITLADNKARSAQSIFKNLEKDCENKPAFVLGFTGTGGAGKSSLLDEFIRRFKVDFPNKTVSILSVDPTKRRTGGALLGDRIRMNSIYSPNIFMRSIATRQSNLALSKSIKDVMCILRAASFDLMILETSGIGQSDTEIVDFSDLSMYVMTPEYGSATQLEKIDMLDFADIVAINKSDKRGALDALRDVKKQVQRNKGLFHVDTEMMPVYGTVASNSRDAGMDQFYMAVMEKIQGLTGVNFAINANKEVPEHSEIITVIPENRIRYLAEIGEVVRNYNQRADDQAEVADRLYSLRQSIEMLKSEEKNDAVRNLKEIYKTEEKKLNQENIQFLKDWPVYKKII